MKNKRLNKKLSINKNTISNLDGQQLGNAKGGAGTSAFNCTSEQPSCMTVCHNCSASCSDECMPNTPPDGGACGSRGSTYDRNCGRHSFDAACQ